MLALPPAGVGEVDADLGPIGALVLGEPGIPIDPAQGASEGAGIRDEMGADPSQDGGRGLDESQRRALDFLLVLRLVGEEPRPIVVLGEGAQESERFGRESRTGSLRTDHSYPRPGHRNLIHTDSPRIEPGIRGSPPIPRDGGGPPAHLPGDAGAGHLRVIGADALSPPEIPAFATPAPALMSRSMGPSKGTTRSVSTPEEEDEGDPESRSRGSRTLPRRDRALEILLERQRSWADELVFLSIRPVGDLERAVAELDRQFWRHRSDWDAFLRRPMPDGFPYRTGPLRLLWEHEMFVTSLRELRDLVRPLRVDDHGGPRWALGQYWRLVLETFTAHLEDERGYRDAAVRLLSKE
jgi:hypothetical protein